MGLTTSGADRYLRSIIGFSTPAVSSLTCRLHTSTSPSTSNELRGNGYSRATLSRSSFSLGSSSGYRQLRFPAIQWFSNAGSSAQRARSVALWISSTLVWYDSYTINPSGRVYANSRDISLEVETTDSSLRIQTASGDGGLYAIIGQATVSRTMYWELHSGIPTSSNRLTGGGIDGIPDTTWTFSTNSGWRRAAQSRILTFSSGLSADTNREPTHLGLWRGRPESRGVLHAYWPLSGLNSTARGSVVTIPANSLYLEIDLD